MPWACAASATGWKNPGALAPAATRRAFASTLCRCTSPKTLSSAAWTFFRTLPPNARQAQRSWRGDYGDWKPTPITASAHWPAPTTPGPLKVYDYVCKYGFCIDIAPSVLEDAQAIINSPGSYYAYGRIGVMVVSPARQRVLYLYNG